MIARTWAALLWAAALAGCSILDPYETLPHAVEPGQPAGPRVAICYNALTTTLAEVRTRAQQECTADRRAEPVNTDWYMQYCPVLMPARATFVCTAPKQ